VNVNDEERSRTYASLAAIFAGEPPLAEAGDDLEVERVRLFVNAAGGVPAPPYASWYLDGTLGGPSTAGVLEAYAAQCLEVAPDGGQPPDHIAVELEFLHLLCRHQLAARATRDAPALAAARAAETAFLSGHFRRWVPRFAAAIRGAAPGPLFASAADALTALCGEEAHPLPGARAGFAALPGERARFSTVTATEK
jgi:TorA maturation chaperone TorD